MTACRTCKGTNLYLFLPLGDHPLANGFLRYDQLGAAEPKFALDTHVCLDCGLIQVRDNVPAEYFRNYVYLPSASPQMHRHFDTYASAVFERFLGRPNVLSVDIGCNDGLFLGSLKKRGARTLGIDPADNITQIARDCGIEVIGEYFHPSIATAVRERYGRAKVIVTNNTFHHVDDLHSFMEGVRLLLDDDGVFIVEVPHALELVEKNEFDGVYHEHVSQMTVKSFVALFKHFGMKVFDVTHLEVHGGSIRVHACLQGSAIGGSTDVTRWLEEEERRQLFSKATYHAFRERVETNRAATMDLLRALKAQGKRIAGYGASARGNTLLNYYGIGTGTLDYIADRNHLKQGLYSPGMHIPVVPPERIQSDPPDYLFVLAWNFSDEIIEQESAFRKGGGAFILPLPEPVIV